MVDIAGVASARLSDLIGVSLAAFHASPYPFTKASTPTPSTRNVGAEYTIRFICDVCPLPRHLGER